MAQTMTYHIDKIVSVSEFSQGKSGKIFNDVSTNNCEYMVMKNNAPIAVIVPVCEYESVRKRIEDLEQRIRLYNSQMETKNRIGIAKGLFEVPDDFDEWDIGFGEDYDEDPA